MRDERVIVLGGGIAGLTAAIALRQLGFAPLLYEGAGQIRGIGAGFGLASNAMRALDWLGIAKEVMPLGHMLGSFEICDQNGKTLMGMDTERLKQRYQAENFAIHRADLHRYLLSKVPAGSVFLAKRGLRIAQSKEGVEVFFADGSSVKGDYLLVADGVHSAIRQQLLPASKVRYAGYTCWRAVVDNKLVGLQKGIETWGKQGRVGMTPLMGDRLYWYICVNASRNDPHYRQFEVKDLHQRFAHYHDPIPQAIAATEQGALIWNDIVDIKPIKRYAFGRVLLMGDAAHATTPNMGQGACQAIEDAVVLADTLKPGLSMESAFVRFEQRRLQRTHYITNTSRRAGWLAQLDNALLIALRNGILAALPPHLAQYSLRHLYETDFMAV